MADFLPEVEDLVGILRSLEAPMRLKDLVSLFTDERNPPQQVKAKLVPVLAEAVEQGLMMHHDNMYSVESGATSSSTSCSTSCLTSEDSESDLPTDSSANSGDASGDEPKAEASGAGAGAGAGAEQKQLDKQAEGKQD